MSEFLVGSTPKIGITVTDDTGTLSNGTVTLTILDPSGNQTTPSPDNPSTGVYEYYLDLDEAGYFTAVWDVTIGSYTTVMECSVCANPTGLS